MPWWQATVAAIRAIDLAVRRSVRGIGFDGRVHGATLLGSDDQPLRAAILWNDSRSFDECAEREAIDPNPRYGWQERIESLISRIIRACHNQNKGVRSA